jgi:hypothetical protein
MNKSLAVLVTIAMVMIAAVATQHKDPYMGLGALMLGGAVCMITLIIGKNRVSKEAAFYVFFLGYALGAILHTEVGLLAVYFAIACTMLPLAFFKVRGTQSPRISEKHAHA